MFKFIRNTLHFKKWQLFRKVATASEMNQLPSSASVFTSIHANALNIAIDCNIRFLVIIYYTYFLICSQFLRKLNSFKVIYKTFLYVNSVHSMRRDYLLLN